MTSVMIVADSGTEMARLTATVGQVRGMEIARHASGRTSIAGLLAAHRPSLVLISELSPRHLTFERIAEVRDASPQSAVVVVAAGSGARWLARALQSGATAALPAESGTAALAAVLTEVLIPDTGRATDVALAA